MIRHVLFRTAGVLIFIAAQQAYADSISCSFPIQANPSGTSSDGYIEIDSFSFGASNPEDQGGAGGTSTGKVSVSQITISKTTDTASAKLLQALLVSGAPFPSVSCNFYGEPNAVGIVRSPYLTAVITNVSLAGFNVTGHGPNAGRQRTKFWFNFENISWK